MKAEPEPEPDVAVASMEDNLATFLGALLQPVGSCCKQISTPQLEIVVANMEGRHANTTQSVGNTTRMMTIWSSLFTTPCDSKIARNRSYVGSVG